MPQNVIAMFPDLGHAEAVVADLIASGVERERISIVSHDATDRYRDLATLSDEQRKQKAAAGVGGGALLGATTGALLALGVAFVPGAWIIGAGPLAAILGSGGIGAAIGATAGGISAALDTVGIPNGPAQRYAEALRRGATMVAVEVPDERAKHVAGVIDRHDPIDMDRSAKRWQDQGWTAFDAKAAPYDEHDVVKERGKWELERRPGKVRGYDAPPVGDPTRVHSYPIERPVSEE